MRISDWSSDVCSSDLFIVPMAIPLVAGPSGMAAVMLLAAQEPGRMADWTLALTLAWLATAILLFSATYLYKLLRSEERRVGKGGVSPCRSRCLAKLRKKESQNNYIIRINNRRY